MNPEIQEDTPLIGSSSYINAYITFAMFLPTIIHYFFLGILGYGLFDLIMYIFLCLIIVPLLFIFCILPTSHTYSYYIAGEFNVRNT
jgi:hypothetical protein